MTDMKGVKPLMRVFCIFSMVLAEIATSAYMFQKPIHAETTDQIDVRTDQLAVLTKRMDEWEQSRTKDVKELNLRIQELFELRESDARMITRLNDEVEEQKRLHVKDLDVITVLTTRVGKLERQCGSGESSKNDLSNQKRILPHDDSLNHNRSDLSFHPPVATSLDNTTAKEQESTANFADTTESETIRGQGRIQTRQPGRNTRVSPSEDTVAFHAILTHTITDPSTNHVIVFNKVITNTGGAHYSPNTGIFTATQSGVHIFSWAVGVPLNQFVHSDLVRNNAVIGSALTGEGDSYGSATSATAAVHLEVGDEVWVRVNGHGIGSDLRGTWSMFTGFRIR